MICSIAPDAAGGCRLRRRQSKKEQEKVNNKGRYVGVIWGGSGAPYWFRQKTNVTSSIFFTSDIIE